MMKSVCKQRYDKQVCAELRLKHDSKLSSSTNRLKQRVRRAAKAAFCFLHNIQGKAKDQGYSVWKPVKA
jgi:hypothetical protein